uniref:P-type Ca(2+) transporter n=1 Tax=Macrostomum lignano TaxID=282301 RepID=A0A1I8F266_9PLAT
QCHAGISESEVPQRQRAFGANSIPPKPPKTFLQLAFEAMQDYTLLMLVVCAFISLAISLYQKFRSKSGSAAAASHGDDTEEQAGWIEGVAIAFAVIVVVIVTAFNDWSKERQFRGLQAKLEQSTCLIANDLKVDESSLTGESDHVKKSLDRDPVLLSGTNVMEGSGRMLITAVGINSQAGIIFSLLGAAADDDNGDDGEAGGGKKSGNNKAADVDAARRGSSGAAAGAGNRAGRGEACERGLRASGNSEEALPPISLTPGDHGQLVLRCRAGVPVVPVSTARSPSEESRKFYTAFTCSAETVKLTGANRGAPGTTTTRTWPQTISSSQQPEAPKKRRSNFGAKEKSILQAKLTTLAIRIGNVGSLVAAGLLLYPAGQVLRDHLRSTAKPALAGESLNFTRDLQRLIDFVIIAGHRDCGGRAEGLPLAVTISLAYSVKKDDRTNNLVRHLDACETMGNATAICSDKTGTLTTNRMTVVQAYLGGVLEKTVTKKFEDYPRRISEAFRLRSQTSCQSRLATKPSAPSSRLVLDMGRHYDEYRSQAPPESIHHVYTFNSVAKINDDGRRRDGVLTKCSCCLLDSDGEERPFGGRNRNSV